MGFLNNTHHNNNINNNTVSSNIDQLVHNLSLNICHNNKVRNILVIIKLADNAGKFMRGVVGYTIEALNDRDTFENYLRQFE